MKVTANVEFETDNGVDLSWDYIQKNPGVYQESDEVDENYFVSFGHDHVLIIINSNVEVAHCNIWKHSSFIKIHDVDVTITLS